MPLTPYHAKYYAHELSRVGGEVVDRLGRALFDACVELNPHQIEAASSPPCTAPGPARQPLPP